MTRRAIFLDRDGLIDELVYYPSTAEWESPRTTTDLRLIEAAFAPLQRAERAGWLLFVVTNQPSFAKGKVAKEELVRVHDAVMRALAAHGVAVTRSYTCFHHPQGVVAEYAIACECRKPGTLFLREAAREFDVDLSRSWMAGDQDSDLACGRAAGCKVALIAYRQSQDKRGRIEPDFHATTLADFVDHLLENDG